MTMLRVQYKVVRDCRADHSIFLFARGGLWRKLSDWTELLVRCSWRSEQSDSRDAHFLSGAFPVTCSLLHFSILHPAGSRGRLAQAQFPVSHKWLRLGPSVVIVPRISKTWCQHFLRTSPCARRREVLPNQQTLTCEMRRLRPRSSRRLRNLSMTSSFSSLRAVLATALPCSDECAVDWRGPQTQRRFCAQQVIGSSMDLRTQLSS